MLELRPVFRLAAWLSFFVFFIGFVLFFVCYVGNSWYVIPPDGKLYPPEAVSIPVTLGLFWMCVYGHCKYDLRVDYMVVGYIPYPDIQYAYQNFRTVCMVIITISAIMCLITIGLKLIFLSRFTYSHLAAIAAGISEVLAGILLLVGLIVFGAKFRGSTATLPFGWSYWLMVPVILILLLDGIFQILLSIAIFINLQKRRKEIIAGGAAGRPLAAYKM